MMFYEFVVGDWSYDGHNQTDNVFMKSKASSSDQIKKAFKKGSKKIFGFDVTEKYCSEYEENYIPKEVLEKLNIKIDEAEVSEKDGVPIVYIGAKEWVDIYASLANIGDPSLKIEMIACDSLNVGGYGLFLC